MIDNLEPSKQRRLEYVCLMFLSMLCIVAFISPLMLAYRQVKLGMLVLPGGTVIFATSFIFTDIVSEIYGYRIAKWLVICALASQIIMTLSVYLVLHLPAPASWHHNIEYSVVFNHIMRYTAASVLGNILGEFTNIFLISKWKIMVKGKYFWLRSIGSSAVGELVLTVAIFSITFFNLTPDKRLLTLILSGYSYKIAVSLILAFPANLLVRYLKFKHTEKVPRDIAINPFKNVEILKQ